MAKRTPAAVVAFSKSTHSGLLRYLGIFDVIDTVVNMMKPRGLPLNFTLSHILKQVSFLYCGAVQCELASVQESIGWTKRLLPFSSDIGTSCNNGLKSRRTIYTSTEILGVVFYAQS
jgi:hypothetical protein